MSKHTPGYEITQDGRVFSVCHDWRGYGRREISQSLNASGYLSVRLTVGARRIRITVHKLVALAFIGERPAGMQVCHINGDKLDNRVENLRYGTAKDNALDREIHGRTSRGLRHSRSITSSRHRHAVKRGSEHYETKARLSHE